MVVSKSIKYDMATSIGSRRRGRPGNVNSPQKAIRNFIRNTNTTNQFLTVLIQRTTIDRACSAPPSDSIRFIHSFIRTYYLAVTTDSDDGVPKRPQKLYHVCTTKEHKEHCHQNFHAYSTVIISSNLTWHTNRERERERERGNAFNHSKDTKSW
jgi:hypothetical protein